MIPRFSADPDERIDSIGGFVFQKEIPKPAKTPPPKRRMRERHFIGLRLLKSLMPVDNKEYSAARDRLDAGEGQNRLI